MAEVTATQRRRKGEKLKIKRDWEKVQIDGDRGEREDRQTEKEAKGWKSFRGGEWKGRRVVVGGWRRMEGGRGWGGFRVNENKVEEG